MAKINITDIENYLMNMNKEKICIIPCPDSEKIKKIHQYLNNNFKIINHTSLKSDLFENYEFDNIFIKCYNCDYRRVRVNNYHLGVLESNKDEYWSGKCPKCKKIIEFEPNYDDCDDVIRHYKNNIIVIGDYIEHNILPNHTSPHNITNEEFKEITSNLRIYEMDKPAEPMNNMKLQKYIDTQLKNIVDK